MPSAWAERGALGEPALAIITVNTRASHRVVENALISEDQRKPVQARVVTFPLPKPIRLNDKLTCALLICRDQRQIRRNHGRSASHVQSRHLQPDCRRSLLGLKAVDWRIAGPTTMPSVVLVSRFNATPAIEALVANRLATQAVVANPHHDLKAEDFSSAVK